MNILEQYQGNYYTAESASKYIDIDTIVSGCRELADSGTLFDNISNKVCSAGDVCNGEALSIDGDTLTDYIYEQGELIGEVSSTITALANDIIERAYNAYNQIQTELNNKAYNLECEYVNELNRNNR